jgi:hypothetical protein
MGSRRVYSNDGGQKAAKPEKLSSGASLMTPEKRLLEAFELSQFSKGLFFEGLHRRFLDLSEESVRKIYLERVGSPCWTSLGL